MTKTPVEISQIEFKPLSLHCWEDFEKLFGLNGACAGCWCMWFRMTNKDFQTTGKDGHKDAMRTLVQAGVEPGLLAYVDGAPAGWVTLAPRIDYARLSTSKILAPVDEITAWSIPCFFIHRNYRRAGLMGRLIQAAVTYARDKGAKVIEAYPYDTKGKASAVSIYTGVASTFRQAGFVEVARRSPKRPIMRLYTQ